MPSDATALRAVDALDAWERGDRLPAARRGDALLTGVPGAGAGLPVGRRDALLLDRYRSSFGDRLDAEAHCPGCGTTVELALSCAEVLAAGATAAEPVAPLELAGYRITWRPVTGVDLAAVATAGLSTVEAAAELWRRCVVEAIGPRGPVAAEALPAPVRAGVLAAVVRADPYVEITFALSCSECGRQWDSQLDVAAFAWERIRHRAQQALHDVHTLARAYGWTEPDVLALSEPRRAAYLRLVGDD